MREIEIKAWAEDPERVRAHFDGLLGPGRPVEKMDHYFHLPGSPVQSLRIRRHGGRMEVACKRASSVDGREDNEEYEFGALPSDYGRAVAFFHALGHEDFFLKHKTGWEWNDGDAHIELLQVNDIGTFLEIEVLLPFDCPDTEVGRAYSHILRLLADAGMDDMDIERRSYRQMIFEKEGIDGIQG